jgi:methyl-accepting chemotaxis protein
VTQQNAANAEESASSSEEMNAQAEQMKLMVDDLVTLVSGVSGRGQGGGRDPIAAPKGRSVKGIAPSRSRHSLRAPGERSDQAVSPEKAIPFDEDESFQDF